MVDTVASLQAVIGADVSGLDSGLASAETKLTSFGDKIKNVGASVMGAGAQITALTAPIGLAFGVGLNTASQFQDVMAEIEARTGATSAEMETLSDYALQMGADTAFSGQQAADALLQLLTSGSSVEEAMAILPSVLDAAAASGADLGATADTVTDIMAAFGLGAGDAESVVNSLAKAAGSSSADMVSLGQGFANVGGVANMFGMDVNQVAASLAILSENGIKGADAGTALKSMLLQMSRPTDDAKRAWGELGLSMYDAEGNMRDLPTVLDEMKFALEDLPASEQNRIMTQLAGSYGVTALAALLGATSIEEMEAAMDAAADAGDVADARMNTFSGSIDSLKGSVETLMITALTPLMDNILAPMVQSLTDVVNSVTDWVDENPELASTIFGVIGAMTLAGPVIIGLGAVISSIGAIASMAALRIGILAGAVVWLAAMDFEKIGSGFETWVDGLESLAEGDLATGLQETWSGTGEFLEGIFQPVWDLIEGITGWEMPDISEGFDAWGYALSSAVTLVGVGLDDIKRGFDRFGLDVQLSIAGFLLSIEQALQGTPFEVDWGMENVVADLEAQIQAYDINGAIHDTLSSQIGDKPIDMTEMIEITAPDGSIITMPLGQAIENADLSDFSERTKLKIRPALEQAIAEGDLESVTVLNDTAIELGIAVEDLQPDIAALRDGVVAEIEAQDYSASVTATVSITTVVGSVNNSGLWAGMQAAIGAGGAGGNVTVNNYTTNVAGSMLGSEDASNYVADGNANGPQ